MSANISENVQANISENVQANISANVPVTTPSKKFYENISICQIAIYSWFATSLGLPFLTTIYIQKLGESIGLECLGESGIIKNKYPHKNLNQCFINDLKNTGLFPLTMLLGPFSIPLSIGFGIKATINYLRYKS